MLCRPKTDSSDWIIPRFVCHSGEHIWRYMKQLANGEKKTNEEIAKKKRTFQRWKWKHRRVKVPSISTSHNGIDSTAQREMSGHRWMCADCRLYYSSSQFPLMRHCFRITGVMQSHFKRTPWNWVRREFGEIQEQEPARVTVATSRDQAGQRRICRSRNDGFGQK